MARKEESTPEKHLSALTGRPRKLTDGVMIAITKEFRKGARVADLAERYGVSDHTIYSICYWTPRENQVEP